jgi:SOS response regulatory protein OraA/RecX
MVWSNREIADEVLEAVEGQEAERLKALIDKKSKLSRYQNDPQKLMQYLVGQGFSWQDVKQALAADQPEENT